MSFLITFCTLAATLTTCMALQCYQCLDPNKCEDKLTSDVVVRECPTSISEYHLMPWIGVPMKAQNGKDEISCVKVTTLYQATNVTIRDCFPNINCSMVFDYMKKTMGSHSASCLTCNYNLCNSSSSILASTFSILSAFLISAYYFS